MGTVGDFIVFVRRLMWKESSSTPTTIATAATDPITIPAMAPGLNPPDFPDVLFSVVAIAVAPDRVPEMDWSGKM